MNTHIFLSRYKKTIKTFLVKKVPYLELVCLRFYGPVNPMGSCRARSVYLTKRLLDRLSPLSS